MSKEQWIRNYEHHMAEIESRATDKALKNPKKVEQMNQEAIKRTEEDDGRDHLSRYSPRMRTDL